MPTNIGRTRNTVLNLLSAYGGEVIGLLLAFVLRTVFVNTLGGKYLGINGIFSNILSMLELAELGFGSAVIFKLYKPIRENNQVEINKYVQFFKIIYRIVGFVILFGGICCIPFLPYIIKDYETFAELHLNPILIFGIYLFQSISSYWFFAYRTTVVEAYQKKYKLLIVGYIFSITSRVVQILSLIFLKNYIIYLLIVVGFIILRNFAYAYIAKRLYPECFTKEKVPISRAEVVSVFKDCFALMINKINSVILNATDNIVISSTLGLAFVGLYSNYLLFVTAIKSIVRKFFHAITPSLGNLHAEGKIEYEYSIFKTINFVTFGIFSVVMTGVAVIAGDFITVWIGKEFVVDSFEYGGVRLFTPLALFVGAELYFHGIYEFTNLFRVSAGLFRHRKYVPLIAAGVNIVLSFALVGRLGITGVVIGTIVADLILIIPYNTTVLYRKLFNRSAAEFYLRNLLYILLTAAYAFVCFMLYRLLPFGGWIRIAAGMVICIFVPCALNVVIFRKSPEFGIVLSKAKRPFAKRHKKTNKES